MLTLNFKLKMHWPKLAWVCVIHSKKNAAEILHGPMVEVGEKWVVEAVWDGEFSAGDFDKTDLIYGSGIRQREGDLIFVSSATGIDRLWHVQCGDNVYVSNSFPGILQVSGLNILDDYRFYASDLSTIEMDGLYSYVRSIPTDGPNLNIVYFENMLWDGRNLLAVEKPKKTPPFTNFQSYENYLKKNAENLGMNAQSPLRNFRINMLVGLSSGYDSVACAVVAKYAGCKDAVSIVDSTSLWRGSDSGEKIAPYLDLNCKYYKHDKTSYKNEIAVWAGGGAPGGRNLSLFDYPQPLTLFFSGGFGDTVWERGRQGLSEPKGDFDEFLCEFRLIHGVFMTQVPWWGIRDAAEIQKLSLLDEMKPWTLGTNYDRPIARRLAEEAGVPRELFGIHKKNTASNTPFWWPSTEVADNDFREYLNLHGITAPSRIVVSFLSFLSFGVKLVNSNLLFFMENHKKWKPWLKSPFRHRFFSWANNSLRDKYYR